MKNLGRLLRTLRYLRPEQIWHRLWLRLRRPWHRTDLYRRLRLERGAEPQIVRFMPDLWPGNGAHGVTLLGGRITLLGQTHPFILPVDWAAADKSLLWRFTLHYFEWLADLQAEGSDAAAELGRATVEDWIAHHSTADSVAWHPYPLSLRLVAWLRHGPFLLAGASADFQARFETALAQQARHLARVLEWDVGGNHLIKNLKALTAAAVCLGQREIPLAALQKQLARQILADGCHYELSPSYHLQVLMDLMDLQALLEEDSPSWLSDSIDRMSAALAFFRHGDGGLALFNDGDEGSRPLIEALDARCGGRPKTPDSLPQAGYYRLQQGGLHVLFDCAKCGPDDLPAHAHADALSVEVSVGAQRLIVNCGTYAYQDPVWRQKLRGTAAHSTLSLDDEDSAEVYGVFRLGRRPQKVSGQRDGTRVIGRHDGYRHLGVSHQRILNLTGTPARLEGLDRLDGKLDGRLARAHFHMHPDITVTREADHLLLTLPDGEVWTFQAKGGRLALAESVYSPQMGRLLPSRQIIVEMKASGDRLLFSWTLRPAALPGPKAAV
ncbi:heparinase II/III family protein [Magnetospira thiophila]